MENVSFYETLFCILSRINLLISFFPDSIQEDLEDAKVDIMSVLRKLGFNVSLGEARASRNFDLITLYNELVSIEQSLTSVIVSFPDYSSLEDAKCDISLAIKGLADRDSTVSEHHKKRLLEEK